MSKELFSGELAKYGNDEHINGTTIDQRYGVVGRASEKIYKLFKSLEVFVNRIFMKCDPQQTFKLTEKISKEEILITIDEILAQLLVAYDALKIIEPNLTTEQPRLQNAYKYVSEIMRISKNIKEPLLNLIELLKLCNKNFIGSLDELCSFYKLSGIQQNLIVLNENSANLLINIKELSKLLQIGAKSLEKLNFFLKKKYFKLVKYN